MAPDRRQRRRDDTGLSTLQLALTAPALLLFIMVTVQGGLWWHAKQLADAAAAEAVDVAQTPTGSAGAGEAAARDYLRQAGHLRNVRVVVDRGAEHVTADVHGDAPQLLPGFAWAVTARSRAPIERFVPEPER